MFSDSATYQAQAELDTIWNQIYERCVAPNDNYIDFFTSGMAEVHYKRCYLAAINYLNDKYDVQLYSATPDFILNNMPHHMSIQSWREDWKTADWDTLF